MSQDRQKLDIVGDLHGCYDELLDLLAELGYAPNESGLWTHPDDRKLVFVGDFTDRGPKSLHCLVFVAKHVEEGLAFAVQGNHDNKLARYLKGNPVKVSGGLQTTVKEFENASDTLAEKLKDFIFSLNYWEMFDDDQLLVCHAAPPFEENAKGELVWLSEKAQRARCLYGKTDGTYKDGYPVREDWALDYKGYNGPYVVYGHISCGKLPYMSSMTCCVDTGAVFGYNMTALRWPEKDIVQVETPQYAEK